MDVKIASYLAWGRSYVLESTDGCCVEVQGLGVTVAVLHNALQIRSNTTALS